MISLSPFQLGIFMIQCSCTLHVKLCECLNCIAMGRTVPSPKGYAYVLETVNDMDVHPLPLCGREGGLSASRQSVSRLFSSTISLVYPFTPAHDLFRWHFPSQSWTLHNTKWSSLCWTVCNTTTFKPHLNLTHISEMKRGKLFLLASNIICYFLLHPCYFVKVGIVGEYPWSDFVPVIHMHLFYSCLQTE